MDRIGEAAAHRGEAVVGAGGGSTNADPRCQDSYTTNLSDMLTKSKSIDDIRGCLVSASRQTERSDQTHVLPKTSVCTCSRRPNLAGQAVESVLVWCVAVKVSSSHVIDARATPMTAGSSACAKLQVRVLLCVLQEGQARKGPRLHACLSV